MIDRFHHSLIQNSTNYVRLYKTNGGVAFAAAGAPTAVARCRDPTGEGMIMWRLFIPRASARPVREETIAMLRVLDPERARYVDEHWLEVMRGFAASRVESLHNYVFGFLPRPDMANE